MNICNVQNICKRICVLPFAKNMVKNLSNKYSQKLFDRDKNSTTDAIKTASKIAIKKTAEVAGDLIGNNIADKITNVSKTFSVELCSKNDDSKIEIKVPKEQ